MILMDGMAIYYLKEGPGGSWQETEVDRCRGCKMPRAFIDPARTESHGSAFLMPFRQQAVGEEGRLLQQHRGNELFHISKYWKGTFGECQKTAQSQRHIFIHATWRLKGISQYNTSAMMIRLSYIIIIIKTYVIIG